MDYSALSHQDLVRECIQSREDGPWREFIHRFNPAIARNVRKTFQPWRASSQCSLEDLVQDVYFKLCSEDRRRLRPMQTMEDGACFSYLGTIATNHVYDDIKRRRTQKRGRGSEPEDLDSVSERLRSEGFGEVDEMEWEIFLNQVDVFLKEFFPQRDQSVFWLYYVQGFTAVQIAALPPIGLSESGVESAIGRITRSLREHFAKKKGFKAVGSS